MKKIMLLGAGELGRELTISLKRLGCTVVACDRYENAPAMQVSDRSLVFDMLNEADVIELMRREMKSSSFRMWRKRVSSRGSKHALKVHEKNKSDRWPGR